MDAVTYPVDKIVNLINGYFIPLRINVNSNAVHDKYHHIWTPTLSILNSAGSELQKTIGFFGADELPAILHLGIAKARLDAGEFDTALVHLNKLLDNYLSSCAVPEAIYFKGVASYKMDDNASHLKYAYDTLVDRFPGNEWTKRASPYRLL